MGPKICKGQLKVELVVFLLCWKSSMRDNHAVSKRLAQLALHKNYYHSSIRVEKSAIKVCLTLIQQVHYSNVLMCRYSFSRVP